MADLGEKEVNQNFIYNKLGAEVSWYSKGANEIIYTYWPRTHPRRYVHLPKIN